MNKAKTRKALPLLISLAIILAMMTSMAIPALAAPGDAGMKIESHAVAPDVYKLVFSAMSPGNICSMLTVFTYDNTVIQAVSSDAGHADVAIFNDDVTNLPIEVLATTGSGVFFAMTRWKTQANFTGFECTLIGLGDHAEPNGSYIEMLAFYFRLQDGKTIADIDNDTFGLLDCSDPGGLVNLFYPFDPQDPTSAGVAIIDLDNSVDYYWGAYDQADYPSDTVDIDLDISIFSGVPTGAVNDDYTVDEGSNATLDSVLVNDEPGSIVDRIIDSSGTEQSVLAGGYEFNTDIGGTVTIYPDGTFLYSAPVLDHSGAGPFADNFEYIAELSDGSYSNQATVTIDIEDTVPIAVDNDYTLTEEHAVMRFQSNVTSNDVMSADWIRPPNDPNPLQNKVWKVRTEDGAIEYEPTDTYNPGGAATVNTVNGGRIWIKLDGAFEYVPPSHFKGEDSFQYILNDSDNSPSDWATVTLQVPGPPEPPNPLTGTAIIDNMLPRIGDVLTGSLDGSNNTGILSYEWKRDGATVGTGTSYVVQQDDVGKTITLEIKSDVEYGTLVSEPTAAVKKKEAPAAPVAPTLDSKTYDTVTLVANSDYEYSIDGVNWQSSNVFDGLIPDTAYTFYQRLAETPDTEASAASPGLTESTEEYTEAPTISGPASMTFAEGYATTSSLAFTLTGEPAPSVTQDDDHGGMITWNDATMCFDISEGLLEGSYSVTLTADNGIAPPATATFTLIITTAPPVPVAPTITGPGELTLTVGYAARASEPFSLTGDPAPTVSQDTDHGGRIVWNSVTGRLDISAGLPIGSYSLELTADNSAGTDAITFTLTVQRASGGGGGYIGCGSGSGSGGSTTPIDDTDTPTVETPENAFTDVSEDDWFYDAVLYMYGRELMIGVPANRFDPDGTLTRGMIVTILYRLAGEPDVEGLTNPFSDVAEDLWYTDAIKWGADKGIVLGYGNGRFGPNDPVTKEQLAALIDRTQRSENTALPENGGTEFDDISSVSDWALESVTALNAQGLFDDIPSSSFNPRNPATRAEVASVFYKWLSALDDVS